MTKDSDRTLIASLRLFARSLCRNSVDADRLVKDTFEIASRSSRKMSSQMLLQHLLTIMRKLYYGEAESSGAALIEPEDYLVCLYQGLPVRSGSVARHELETAISLLPVHLREAFVLYMILELDTHRVGEVLGCDAATVFSRVNRARRMVKIHLEKLPKTWTAGASISEGESGGKSRAKFNRTAANHAGNIRQP